MARQGTYSQKSFLRQAPNKLLKQYLAPYGVGLEIQWDRLDETSIEEIYGVVQESHEPVQREIDADSREIHALADDGGVRTLIEEGGTITTQSILRQCSTARVAPGEPGGVPQSLRHTGQELGEVAPYVLPSKQKP